MAWYRTGTVALTNGSTVVTGTGTAFVVNVQPGHAINLPDGRAYEVLSVQSDTQLTLGNPNGYLGATANGQAYSVQPNQGFSQAAAARIADFLSQFGGYVTTVLAGLFPDGTLGRPGIAFANDQDTGLRRKADNAFALTAGGVDALDVKADGSVSVPRNFSGNVAFGATANPTNVSITSVNQTNFQLENTAANSTDTVLRYRTPERIWDVGINVLGYNGGCYQITDRTANVERLRIDINGNLLVGGATGTCHIIKKGVSVGNAILSVRQAGDVPPVEVYGVDFNGATDANAANSAFKVGRCGTGRSIAATGTINASGADYAEYMAKADGCGPIAKGDVVGIDRDGKLTRTWAQALSFMVKSTDPNLVGGDAWSEHIGPRPEEPGDTPVAPVMPTAPSFGDLAIPTREPDEDDNAFAARLAHHIVVLLDAEAANEAYQAALTAFQEQSVAYPGELAEFSARREAYDRDLPIWEAALEAARATVDRIAYCGQTPVNVDADTLAACRAALDDGHAVYLVAVANGGGISVKAVREADMTIGDYMRRIGKVLRIEADRPVVDVQHG